MKSGWKSCENCGNKLHEGRYDRAFCNDRCAAAWHRARTPDGQHARKQPGQVHSEQYRTIEKDCENCGTGFKYNEYADRSGQRVPQYCSNKCRQAAYRARKAGKAASGQQQRQQQQRGQQQQRDQKQQQQNDRFNDWRQRNQKQSWWNVLGVSNTSGYDAAKTAWRKLVNQWHTDKPENRTAEAEEMIKVVNNAHDEAKRYYGKNVRQQRV
jgi:hypothetical protein